MKFKENLKRFFTLNRHDAGFTLVELIVVIAILAILAGVAVPAYSGYISQANKSNDETLISDIEQALALAYYSGTLTENGHVLVTMNGVNYAGNTQVEQALLAAFDTVDGLKLKYDGWAPEMLQAAMAGNYASVAGSSYAAEGADELLGEVQKCTTYLTEFINDFISDPNAGYHALAFFFQNGDENALEDIMVEAGLREGNSYTGSQEALSNAVVFALAQHMANEDNDIASQFAVDFSSPEAAQSYMLNVPIADQLKDAEGNLKEDALYTISANYAALKAVATYLGGDAQTAFENISLEGDTDTIIASLESARQSIYVANMDKLTDYYVDPNGGKSQAQIDGEAFVSIMDTVNSVSGDYTNATDLSNGDLMTDGSVSDRVNGYISGASAATNVGYNGTESAGVVYVYVTADGVRCVVDMADVK